MMTITIPRSPSPSPSTATSTTKRMGEGTRSRRSSASKTEEEDIETKSRCATHHQNHHQHQPQKKQKHRWTQNHHQHHHHDDCRSFHSCRCRRGCHQHVINVVYVVVLAVVVLGNIAMIAVRYYLEDDYYYDHHQSNRNKDQDQHDQQTIGTPPTTKRSQNPAVISSLSIFTNKVFFFLLFKETSAKTTTMFSLLSSSPKSAETTPTSQPTVGSTEPKQGGLPPASFQQQQQQQQHSNNAINSIPEPTAGRIFVAGYNQNLHQILFPEFNYFSEEEEEGGKQITGRASDSDLFGIHHVWEPPSTSMVNDTVSTGTDTDVSSSSSSFKVRQRTIYASSKDILLHGNPSRGGQSVEDAIKYFPGKVLFINGESRGCVFRRYIRPQLMRILNEEQQELQQRQQQQAGSSSSSLLLYKQAFRNVANRIYQMGPFEGSSSSTSQTDRHIEPRYDARYDYKQLARRNSDEFFFLAQVLGSKLLSEAMEHRQSQQGQKDTILTSNKSQLDLSNTPTWKSLTDPNHRAHNTGLHHAVVYVQSNCEDHRQKAAVAISDLVQVHYGPRCVVMNDQKPNATFQIGSKDDRAFDWKNNVDLMHEYRYCLVMENRQLEHYMTEKLLNAVLAGCLPIYFGLPNIHDIFNPKSFIHYDINNPQPALDLIHRLEQNETMYEEMLSVPLLQFGAVDKHFSFHPSLGDGSLHLKIRAMMGIQYPGTLIENNDSKW